jgi:hypothetical protein
MIAGAAAMNSCHQLSQRRAKPTGAGEDPQVTGDLGGGLAVPAPQQPGSANLA